jgi:hypothetical protein
MTRAEDDPATRGRGAPCDRRPRRVRDETESNPGHEDNGSFEGDAPREAHCMHGLESAG